MSGATFKAAMIQMRSGLTPAANVDAAAKLIGEAKSAGADYVQTPEMTNVLAGKREQLFNVIAPEESDASLAAFRDLARKLKIYVHAGSMAIKTSPEKAANRSFLISPEGEIVARYDKIHMFDVDLAGGESYRESNNYRAGELRDLGRPAVGPHGTDHLLRPAFPAALPGARRSRARAISPSRRPSPNRPARRTGTF